MTAPPGREVRPAPDRLKEALFNVLQFEIPGARILDLCAGSGSIGIEAISREAALAVLVERSPKVAQFIRKNLVHCHISRGAEILVRDAEGAIELLIGRGEQFDFIFFDPPYASDVYATVMQRLGGGELLAEGGRVVVMHHRRRALAPEYDRLRAWRELQQGENMLTFYRLS